MPEPKLIDKNTQPKKSNLLVTLTGVAVLLFCAAVAFVNPRFLKAVSFQSYDVLATKFAVEPQSDKVVIVDIDRKSLGIVGQWAWPRFQIARMVDNLWAAGARVIAFDVVFPEIDRTSPGQMLSAWKDAYGIDQINIEGLPADAKNFDQIFIDSLKHGKTVLGCYLFFCDADVDVNIAEFQLLDPNYKGKFLIRGTQTPDDEKMHQANHIEISLPSHLAVSDTGFYNTVKDQDDIVRRTPLVAAVGDMRMYPALSLQAVRLFLDQPRFTVVFDAEGVRGMKYVQLEDKIIPTDATGHLVLNFRNKTFPTLSAIDVLDNQFDQAAVKDRIVLIGTSAVGLYDMRNTPLHTEMPGVEIQATAIDNMLAGDMLKEPRWMVFLSLFGLVVGGLVLMFVVIRTRALFSVLVLIFCMLYPMVLSIVLLKYFNLVFVPTPLMIAWVLTYFAVTIVKYWQKEIVEEFNARLRIMNENLEREIVIRKQTEADLVVARNQALSAAEAKSQFLANMSHEIRTPMNGVIGMAELALKTRLNPKQLNYLNKITISAKALLRIINDILDFSKIEAGKLDVEKTEFQLLDVVEELADLFSDKAAGTGVDYVIDFDPQIPSALYGDPLRLRQIIVNLLGNAFKFTTEGQVVLRMIKLDETRSVSHQRAVKLKFEVQDSGIGIAQENIDKLFSSFTQVDGSTSRKYGGTGLGLSISKQLVELMGGVISLHSEQGVGTVFSFILPFDCQSEANEPEFPIPEELQNRCALVACSNASQAIAVGHMLARLGFSTKRASGSSLFDIPQGICRFAIADFELINNTKILSHIKSVTEKVLGLTPSVAEETVLEDRGVDLGLTKPIKITELYDSVLEAFGHQSGRRAIAVKGQSDFEDTRFHGLHVILAEDNIINQEVALENLKSVGIKADIACNGLEVLKLLDERSYDLVLMDVQMPDMDGYAASDAIRQRRDDISDIPIIAMTAHAMIGDMEKCLNAGMSDYLSKPIDPQKMFEAIARWVPKKDQVPSDWIQQVCGDEGDEEQVPVLESQLQESRVASDQTEPKNVVVDYAAALRRVRGNEKLLLRLFNDFMASYGDVFDRITAALNRNDLPQAAKLAHALHGTAGNLSLLKLQQVAKKCELIAKGEEQGDIKHASGNVQHEVVNTFREINVLIAEKTTLGEDQKIQSSLSLTALTASLVELDELLESGSSRAMEEIEKLEFPIQEQVDISCAKKLSSQVMSFDYGEARKTVQKILTQLRGAH